MSRVAAVALLLLFAITAQGQIGSVQVVPPAPTPDHFVRLVVTHPSCPTVDRVVRNGAFLDIESDSPLFCIATPPIVTTTVNAGYLPPGTYTIRYVNTTVPPEQRIQEANLGTVTVAIDDRRILPVPAAPTTAHFLSVTVRLPSCVPAVAAVRNGSFIDVHTTPRDICLAAEPIIATTLGIGYLPAGTYTVRMVNVNNPSAPVVEFPDVGSIFVAESHGGEHIPTLDARGMAMLVLSIAIAAFIALRRAAL